MLGSTVGASRGVQAASAALGARLRQARGLAAAAPSRQAGSRSPRSQRYAAAASAQPPPPSASAPPKFSAQNKPQKQGPPPSQSKREQQPERAPPPAPPAEPSALASRAWLQQHVPYLQLKAVGVSFDDRQADVRALHKGQGVALVREPTNPHDPRAVAIRTLDGRRLGYIPRHQTFHFLQEMCFGAVGSVGQQGDDGLWGFNVLVQPSIVPVQALALPASLRPLVVNGLQLSGPAGEAVKADTLKATGGRCAVTNAPVAAARERWAFDDGRRVLRLTGFRAEAPEVTQVGALLALDGRRADAPKQLLRQLNCWSEEDLATYLAHQRQTERQRGAQPWKLDLGWLAAKGVPVPPALAPHCVELALHPHCV